MKIGQAIFALALCAAPLSVWAQSTPVYQRDLMTSPHDLAKITRNGQISDAGGLLGDASGRGVNPFAVQDNLGLGECSNSAVSSGQYNALCWGHDGSGNGLVTLDSYGGLANKSLNFRINGTTYPFPGTGNGNIVGPNPTVVGDMACWNNTGGSLQADCGLGVQAIASDTALAAASTATYQNGVRRITFGNGNNAPPEDWLPQSGLCATHNYPGTSTAMANDGGSCRNAGSNSFYAVVPASGIDIRQFGCKLDGVTDDNACVQAATTWLKATKGPLISPAGTTLAHSTTIDISASGITWLCYSQGSQGTSEVFGNSPCAFKWIGAPGGTMMTDIAPSGSPSDLNIGGQELGPFTFHGNAGLAANGLQILSVNQSHFHLLSFDQFTGGTAFTLDVVHATPSTFGTASVSQYDHFDGVIVNNTGGFTSQPIELGNWLDNNSCGSTVCGGNVSFVNFDFIKVNWHGAVNLSGSAVLYNGADNVVVDAMTCSSETGVGYCADFSVSTLNSGLAPANSNIIKHMSAPTGQVTAAAIARGTTSFPTCTPNVTCPFGNLIREMDRGNNTVFPVREPGTSSGVFWTDTFGNIGPFSRVNTTSSGASIGMSAATPSVGSCTGLGSGTCSMFSDSADGAGAIELSPTGSPGAAGTLALTFNTANGAFVTTLGICTATLADSSGSWNARATVQISDASAAATFAWDNNSVNLTVGVNYFINYHCFGI